jgi:HTH-type transcriptional regulator/antitoxin HigA
MKTKLKSISFKMMPSNYRDLVLMHPPRPLHDTIDHDNALAIVMEMAGHELTPDQEDYLEILSELIEIYEGRTDPLRIPRANPLDTIRDLLAAHDLSASDLGRLLGNRALGSKILRGDRKLTVNHIKKLARHFRLDPSIFI